MDALQLCQRPNLRILREVIAYLYSSGSAWRAQLSQTNAALRRLLKSFCL